MKKLAIFLKKHDLKTYILLEVIGLFFVTAFLISSYNHYQDKKALTKFSHDYVNRYSHSLVKTIEIQMMELVESSYLVSLSLSHIESLKELKAEQILYLKNLFKIFSTLSGFHVSLENGDFIHFHNVEQGDNFQTNREQPLPLNVEYCIVSITHDDRKQNEVWKYYNKGDQIIAQETIPNSNYDPRLKEWYLEAKNNKATYIRPDIKLGNFIKNLTITASKPLLKPDQDVWGVATADLDVRKISQFLRENTTTPHTNMFVLNDNQEVVAASNVNMPMSQLGNNARLITLKELEDDVIWPVFNAYQEQKENQFEISDHNKSYIVNFTNFSESFYETFDHRWKLVTIVPFDEIFRVFLQSQQDKFGIYIFAFVLVFLRIILLSRKLSEPIEELTDEAIKIREFNFDEDIKTDSKIKEVSTLSHTMQTMKISLKSFTKYMPKQLVIRLLEKNQDIELGGESKKLTILFSDIAGFTSVSENMTPQALMTHISDYFENLTQIIIHEKGTIDKYIGDAIMAFWGAPDDDPLRSFHACRAALLCQRALTQLNKNWELQNKPVLKTRFGIHAGEVVVGNMGSSERMNYTLIGDSVNLSSRLEGINKIYGTGIIISETVYGEVKDQFLCRVLDIVAVKGKKQGVKIYELLGQKDAENELCPTADQEAFCLAFEKAFEFYLKMNWEKALAGFLKLKGMIPSYDHTVDLYVDRCQTYIKSPPADEDWDGISHLSSK